MHTFVNVQATSLLASSVDFLIAIIGVSLWHGWCLSARLVRVHYNYFFQKDVVFSLS